MRAVLPLESAPKELIANGHLALVLARRASDGRVDAALSIIARVGGARVAVVAVGEDLIALPCLGIASRRDALVGGASDGRVDALCVYALIDGARAIVVAFGIDGALGGRNAFAVGRTHADVLGGIAAVVRAVVELDALDGSVSAPLGFIAGVIVASFATADDGGGGAALGKRIDSDGGANIGGRAINGSNARPTRANTTARFRARVLGYGASSSSNTSHKARQLLPRGGSEQVLRVITRNQF